MNTPKIVQFEKRLSAREQEIQDDIVKVAKDILVRAKRGEYSGIAVAAVDQNGAACTQSSTCDNGPALIGSCYHLMQRVHSDLMSTPVPEVSEDELKSIDQPEDET